MANVGENKGRRLRQAIIKMHRCLIEELRDVSNRRKASNEELDRVFHPRLDRENLGRYYDYPPGPSSVAPQLARLVAYEEKVAAELKRPVHALVFKIKGSEEEFPLEQWGKWSLKHPDVESEDLEIVYAGGWPTYHQLKFSFSLGKEMPCKEWAPWESVDVQYFTFYDWQYGVLWKEASILASDSPYLQYAGQHNGPPRGQVMHFYFGSPDDLGILLPPGMRPEEYIGQRTNFLLRPQCTDSQEVSSGGTVEVYAEGAPTEALISNPNIGCVESGD